jgi:hypothetical protein
MVGIFLIYIYGRKKKLILKINIGTHKIAKIGILGNSRILFNT